MRAYGMQKFAPVMVWSAWVSLSVIASLIPILPNLFNFPPYSVAFFGVQQSLAWDAVGVAVTALAFAQYLVISLVLRRISLVALMWIPATVLTVLASGPIRGVLNLAVNSVRSAFTQGGQYPIGDEIGVALVIGLTQ